MSKQLDALRDRRQMMIDAGADAENIALIDRRIAALEAKSKGRNRRTAAPKPAPKAVPKPATVVQASDVDGRTAAQDFNDSAVESMAKPSDWRKFLDTVVAARITAGLPVTLLEAQEFSHPAELPNIPRYTTTAEVAEAQERLAAWGAWAVAQPEPVAPIQGCLAPPDPYTDEDDPKLTAARIGLAAWGKAMREGAVV